MRPGGEQPKTNEDPDMYRGDIEIHIDEALDDARVRNLDHQNGDEHGIFLDPSQRPLRQKLVVILASGPEDRGMRATLALCAAVTALCMDQEVEVFLVGDGAYWAYEGRTMDIHRNGFPALEALVESLIELGGVISICSACDQVCGIPSDAGHLPRRGEIHPRGMAAVLADLASGSSVTF
jgi:predicted peroxiredoxin